MNEQVFTRLQESKCLDVTHICGLSSSAFSERDILTLNDLLLTKGLHTINVKNRVVGRHIMHLFLTLLNHYNDVHWLSCSGAIADCYDLCAALKAYGCLQQQSAALYEAYFSEAFYADCLIIEYSATLVKEPWYDSFERALLKTSIFQQMPVIYLSYDEDVV
jgi:hypothetical protein